MSPRNQKINQAMRDHSRLALIAAARTVFSRRGYFNCRIADVAREAGMSTGNVYWYFASKEDLLQAVLAEAFESLGAVMAQAAVGSGSAQEKLDALVGGLLAYAREGSEFTAIMIALMGQGSEDMFAKLGFDMEQIGQGYTESLLTILTQAQAEGIVPSDLDPLALTMMFFGLFNGLNLVYGQEWLNLPPETLKTGMLRLFGVEASKVIG